MSILIRGIDMPTYFPIPLKVFPDGRVGVSNSAGTLVMKDVEAVSIQPRGATDMTEPCEICELWMRGYECENEACPVAVMKRENGELKAKVSRLESDAGWDLEINLRGRIYEMGEA